MRALLMFVLCGVAQGVAFAQTAPAALPTNDVTLAFGWAGAEHRIHDDHRWHGSLLVGLSGGHYWTDHLKTEVDASWNSPRGREFYETIERMGGITYALSDYRAYDLRAGVAQVYQFGRNDWVHPYVGAGVDLVRRAATLNRLSQMRTVYVQNRNIPVEIPGTREETTLLI